MSGQVDIDIRYRCPLCGGETSVCSTGDDRIIDHMVTHTCPCASCEMMKELYPDTEVGVAIATKVRDSRLGRKWMPMAEYLESRQ